MQDHKIMKRPLLAIGIALSTVAPAVIGAAFLFGCCVLPFHGVVHRVMPLCHAATDFLLDGGSEQQQPALPVQSSEKTTRLSPSLPPHLFHHAPLTATTLTAQRSSTDLRSFISLGALRCDDDIGLSAFLNTFRI